VYNQLDQHRPRQTKRGMMVRSQSHHRTSHRASRRPPR
jgi:hypothetical protein